MGPGNEMLYNSMDIEQNFDNNETSAKYPDYCRTIRVQGLSISVYIFLVCLFNSEPSPVYVCAFIAFLVAFLIFYILIFI